MQVKDSAYRGFLYRGQRLQVLAEAVLVEKALERSVKTAYVKFLKSGDLVPVAVNERTEEEVRKALAALNEIVASEVMPEPTKYKSRCRDCCFWPVCRRA